MWSDDRTCVTRFARCCTPANSRCVAIAIVAIGIGATTAVFSIVDAALLRPLPFADPGAPLHPVRRRTRSARSTTVRFRYPSFVELTTRDAMLSGIAAFANERFNASDGDRPEQLPGARVSASFFDVLGVDAAAGRTFTPAEDKTGAPAVAVIGRRYWARRFGGEPGRDRRDADAERRAVHRRRRARHRPAAAVRRRRRLGAAGRRDQRVPAQPDRRRPRLPDGRRAARARRPRRAGAERGRRDRARLRAREPDEHRRRSRCEPAAGADPRAHGRQRAIAAAGADGRGRSGAADRVRERREPAARPRDGAIARSRDPPGARRQPRWDLTRWMCAREPAAVADRRRRSAC